MCRTWTAGQAHTGKKADCLRALYIQARGDAITPFGLWHVGGDLCARTCARGGRAILGALDLTFGKRSRNICPDLSPKTTLQTT